LQSKNERIKKQTEEASFLALIDEYEYLRSVLEDHCIAHRAQRQRINFEIEWS
jgi:hypothetical protein